MKRSVTLQPTRWNPPTYEVIKLVNTVTPRIGDVLSEDEVSKLINRPGYSVTIQKARG